MVPEIKVSLSFPGTNVASVELTAAAGSGMGQLTSALQEVAQRTNTVLTELINSGDLSACTGTAVAEGDEDEDSEDESSDEPPESKKIKT